MMLIKMLDIFDKISFDNPNGGVWKQGYDITYTMESYQTEPLTVFVVPHSHNDPGQIYSMSQDIILLQSRVIYPIY